MDLLTFYILLGNNYFIRFFTNEFPQIEILS